MNSFFVKLTINFYQSIQRFQSLRNLSNTRIHIEELINGVKVVTEEVESPISCTSLIIQTGSRFENNCNNGISHFIEHLAMSRKELDETFYDKGIKVNSLTTREFQRYSAVCENEYVNDCIEAFSKIITEVDWDDNDIELQKNVVYSEAIDYDKNPKSLVFDYLHQTAFQGTPLGQNVLGPTKNIAKFNKKYICNFIKENYLPHRLFLVTSGGECHSSIITKASSTFGFLTSCECKIVNRGVQRFTGSQIIYRDDSMPFAHIAIAVVVPGMNSPEYFPLLVASCLQDSWDRTQGGTNRHGSPLARAASTSSLCESFESFYIAYEDVGLWGVYFVGSSENLDDMVLNMQDQWMYMCTTIAQSDVERAINSTKLKLSKRYDGVVNSCYNLGKQVLYTSKQKCLSDLCNEVSNVTAKMIKDVGYNYVYDRCPAVAAIGPTEALPHYNRIRSGMYWLRL